MSQSVDLRSVKTDISDIVQEGAAHVGLDPQRTEVISGHVTSDGKLQLTLEGPVDAE